MARKGEVMKMEKDELLEYNKKLRVENAFLRAKAISVETVEDESKKLKAKIASLTSENGRAWSKARDTEKAIVKEKMLADEVVRLVRDDGWDGAKLMGDWRSTVEKSLKPKEKKAKKDPKKGVI